jgi:hypothetical protein
MTDVAIRFASTDQDAIDIHLFLLLVAKPIMLWSVDALKSMTEVDRVVKTEVALMASIGAELVGTLGLIRVQSWYGPDFFFADRWYFSYPALRNHGVGAKLLAEAGALTAQMGEDLVLTGKLKRRNRGAGRGIVFTAPLVIEPDAVPTMDWDAAAAAAEMT